MLRTKVMLGLGCLLIILLAIGAYSIDRCSALGERIEAVSASNNKVGAEIAQMKRACGAMTGALLSRATDGSTESLNAFDKAWDQWTTSLAAEKESKCKCPGRQEILNRITTISADYHAAARKFIGTPGELGESGRKAATKLGDETMQLQSQADALGDLHANEAIGSGRDIEADVRRTIILLAFLMGLACVVALVASAGLTKGLLNPLTAMSRSIQKVGEGHLDEKAEVRSRDEFGMLATSFNKMAEQLRTYRANTSEELLRLNMTIRATLASFPDPIFVLNGEGTVEFRNPEADELALKLLFSGVTHLPKKVDEKVEEVRSTGEDFLPTQFQEAVKFHLDGQDRYFLPRIVLLRDDKGATFGVAVILEDVTRMLLLDDVKSNLISTVSHELKTPLTSVRMALYLLVEKTVGPLNDKQLDLVATAREDADRLLRTLNDLLDLARLEQGQASLDLHSMPPRKLVDGAVSALHETAHAANIKIETETAADLPDIRIDQQRIAYVFANLITNAIKYSPSGTTVRVKSETGTTRAGLKSVRFSVRDQGPGISPEHQEHIFDRFYRIPGTNKSGAGLGLSIAREIVAAHGGEIGVLSVDGGGSEFMFVIPVESVPAGRNMGFDS